MTTGLMEVAHGKISKRRSPSISQPARSRARRTARSSPTPETLRQFWRAVDQLQLPNSVRAFGPAHVYLFMGWVRDRGVSAGTQHRRQREVKAFFSWCRRMDYVEENPFMRVPMVRREQKVVQPFSKDDLTTLLAACNPQSYVGSRMRAMILFLLDTGVRSSELVSIELCDVLFEEGRVRVLNGKGRKQRWTAISEVALAALRPTWRTFGAGATATSSRPLTAGPFAIIT